MFIELLRKDTGKVVVVNADNFEEIADDTGSGSLILFKSGNFRSYIETVAEIEMKLGAVKLMILKKKVSK